MGLMQDLFGSLLVASNLLCLLLQLLDLLLGIGTRLGSISLDLHSH